MIMVFAFSIEFKYAHNFRKIDDRAEISNIPCSINYSWSSQIYSELEKILHVPSFFISSSVGKLGMGRRICTCELWEWLNEFNINRKNSWNCQKESNMIVVWEKFSLSSERKTGLRKKDVLLKD